MTDRLSIDALRKEFDQHYADLSDQITALAKGLADQSYERFDRSHAAVSDAAQRTGNSVRRAHEQLQRVSDAARNNPKTAATLLSSAGVVSFLLGFAVASLLRGEDRRS